MPALNRITPSCRGEEMALCNPHAAALRERKLQALSAATEPAEPCEKQCMSEKQFLRDHSLYSAMSSWLFAIAGATNIGVLGVLSSKILMAAEQGKPLLKEMTSNKKYNRIALGMMAFGGACMAVSNWLESKKVVTEWQLGAGKLQRKVNIAENKAGGEQVRLAVADQALVTDASAASPGPKNRAASVQPSGDNFAERIAASRMREISL